MGIYIVFGIVCLIILLKLLKQDYTHSKKIERHDTTYELESGHSWYDIKYNKGVKGKYLIFEELSKNIPGYKKIITNIYLFNEHQTRSEIDILLIHETGFYIIESKRYNGYIYGRQGDSTWTQYFYVKNKKQTYKFLNPIHQNYGHKMALKYTLNIMNDNYLKSYVIFSGKCKLKRIKLHPDCDTKVLRIEDMISEITTEIEKTNRVFTNDQIDLYYYKLKAFTNKDKTIKQEHIKKIHEKIH